MDARATNETKDSPSGHLATGLLEPAGGSSQARSGAGRFWGSLLLLVACVGWTGGFLNPAAAEEETSAAGAAEVSGDRGTISLAEVEPALFYQLRRYPKFFGDENTTGGNVLERTQILGSLGGDRKALVDRGIFIDAGVTQFVHGNASGGVETGELRSEGSADIWMTFDTGKAGLWSGGGLFLHSESSWQVAESLNSDVGSLVPANFDANTPTPGESKAVTLPELYYLQALPGNLIAIVGKANWAGIADTNVFANNERFQFASTGLVNNPILGAFIPYTPIGGALVWAPNPRHTVALVAIQTEASATTTGFNEFDGDVTLGGQYQYSPKIMGRPGNYRVIVGLKIDDIPDFEIDPRIFLDELAGVIAPVQKDENYAVLFNFDQYLWVEGGSLDAYEERLDRSGYPGVGHHHQPPNGIGIFGRVGWAPEDRNVIDRFYSFGIGGFGMLIPGRDADNWGIGWSSAHLSDDLRDDVALLGVDLNSFEHAGEVFYNIALTPAIHLTLNFQVVDPAQESIDTALAMGSRIQIDF